MGHKSGGSGFLSGLVWGSMVGAAIGLLMAPRAGDETRVLLREKTNELRDRAQQTAEETRTKATELQERSRSLVQENRERLARTAEAVKRSAQEAWREEPAMGSEPSGPMRQGPVGTGGPLV